jgi:hypothetical protein
VYWVLSAPVLPVNAIVEPNESVKKVIAPLQSVRLKYSSMLRPVSRLAVTFVGGLPPESSARPAQILMRIA